MTTHHTTVIYFRTSSDSKLTVLGSEPEMPSPETDSPFSVLANNNTAPLANSKNQSVDLPRKSNEKTISGLFTYTNGTDVETGLADRRLEQVRASKNTSSSSFGPTVASNASGGGSLVNGAPKGGPLSVNGSIRPRSLSKDGSMRSLRSSMEKTHDHSGTVTPLSRSQGQLEGPNRLSNAENVVEPTGAVKSRNNEATEQRHLRPPIHRGKSEGSSSLRINPAQASTVGPLPSEIIATSPTSPTSPTIRQAGHSAHRLSSPPRMHHIPSNASDITPRASLSPDAPRLTHRHTLQIPRSAGARDFSFSAGEEALSASGHFSPLRDQEPPTPRHRRPSLGLVRRTTRSMASDAFLDDVPPDEDAARWTELIKQKRASRRKRREEEDDERVIVGKKVDEGHVNWVTAYNMLTGIRFTVSRTNAKMDRELTDADFSAKHKFSFDITGNELTPSAKYDFKFKDYSPWVFRHLRSIFGLDPADYLMSLTSKYILSELGSPGKSGSFFYFSRDYKYIIKTIHHAEHKLLRHILRDYYNHVRSNPNTLISQFYGLHRVKIPYGRKIHFVVMNNLFPPHRDIHQTFDLKGSTIGRDFKEDDLEGNPRATLKDLNWLRRDLHLEFQHQIKKMFLDQIQKDVALLQKLHIMDYSLLVGMHDVGKGNEENLRETTLQVFQPGGDRYEENELSGAPLLRTPSRLESVRKARELRQTLRAEKPMPMSLVTAKMPDELKETDERNFRVFYSDDGGVRATHEDGSGGDTVYYLGIIDCLTHYGFVKRIEHFWKGLSNPRTQISPIPPQNYGERFINFISGITMTQEAAERKKSVDTAEKDPVNAHNNLHHHHIPSLTRTSVDGRSTYTKSPTDEDALPRPQSAVDKTMKKAHKQVERTSHDEGRLSEEDLPDRELKSVTVPIGGNDRSHEAGRNSQTLPVVQEVGEGSSDVSSRKSDRAASESREGERPGSRSASKNRQGIRQVSSSTTELTDSHGESHVDEKPLLTPASEYFTPTSPNFSRPIPHSPNLHPSQQQDREKPPRLESAIIPNLAPLYSSPRALDPEKSVVGDNGEIVEGVEKLPGVGLGSDGDRHTVR